MNRICLSKEKTIRDMHVVVQILVFVLSVWMIYSLYRSNFFKTFNDQNYSAFIDIRFLYLTNISGILTILILLLGCFTKSTAFQTIFSTSIVANTGISIVFWPVFFYNENFIIKKIVREELSKNGITWRVQLGLHLVPAVISIVQWINFPVYYTATKLLFLNIATFIYISLVYLAKTKSFNQKFIYPILNNKSVSFKLGISCFVFIVANVIAVFINYLHVLLFKKTNKDDEKVSLLN